MRNRALLFSIGDRRAYSRPTLGQRLLDIIALAIDDAD